MAISKAELRKRYRKKYPEKIKLERQRYLDRKFKKNPELLNKLEKQIHSDFCRLTKLIYDDRLPKKCKVCESTEDLEIHHKRYAYPILLKDLCRLCRKHHIEEHQKTPPSA